MSVANPDPLVLEFGPSEPLEPGEYQLTYTSQFVSDSIANGVREMGPIDATCLDEFTVAPTSRSLFGDGSFAQGECSVRVDEI